MNEVWLRAADGHAVFGVVKYVASGDDFDGIDHLIMVEEAAQIERVQVNIMPGVGSESHINVPVLSVDDVREVAEAFVIDSNVRCGIAVTDRHVGRKAVVAPIGK